MLSDRVATAASCRTTLGRITILSDRVATAASFLPSNYTKDTKDCSCCSVKKSDGAKSGGSDLLFGIKMGKTVKNCHKLSDTTIFSS